VQPPIAPAPTEALLDSDGARAESLCNTSGASFYYSEELDLVRQARVITTHSCPNHFSVCQSNECGGEVKTRALKQLNVISIPLFPVLSASNPLDTLCTKTLVGVALNGVGFYGPSDGGKTDKCLVTLKDKIVTGKGGCRN
jgi:hypothetical protein